MLTLNEYYGILPTVLSSQLNEDVRLNPDVNMEAAQYFRNDYRVRRWCRQFAPISSLENFSYWRTTAQAPENKMYSVCIPSSTADDLMIGVCGLTSIDRVNQNAEFSLYIDPDRSGKGYGTTALVLLLWHAFVDQNLQMVWGETYEHNPALSMFGKIGFECKAKMKKAYYRKGKFIDVHYPQILKGEFLAKWKV